MPFCCLTQKGKTQRLEEIKYINGSSMKSFLVLRLDSATSAKLYHKAISLWVGIGSVLSASVD